jgi:hypothetical protein
VIAGILVFSVIGVMRNNVTAENTGDGHTPGTGRQPTATQVGIGQPVRDGKFEFVVTVVYNQRGYTTVQMSVTNIGNEAQTFFPENQTLIDTAGREYECDTMAVYDFNKDGMIELNPGLKTVSVVPFKAAPGTAFSAVELHDSAFSGGARVALG